MSKLESSPQQGLAPPATASLYLVGEELDPDEAAAVIPIEAKVRVRKGDRPRGTKPGVRVRLARKGLCEFPSCPYVVSDDVNDHVEFLLQVVGKNLPQVTKLITQRHLRCEIVCFFEVDGPPLDPKPFLRPEVLAVAEKLGVAVVRSLA